MPQRLGERLAGFAAFSWRQDADVPHFPDEQPLIVFDGVCVLCSGFARFVATRDPHRHFRFVAAQTPLGTALYRHFGLDAVNYESNLLLADGHAFGKIDGVARILGGLAPPWPMVGALVRGFPAGLGDRAYDGIARRRYRLFGRRQACVIPDAGWRDRMIDVGERKA